MADANTLRIEFTGPPDDEPSGGVDSSSELGPADADVDRQALEQRHAELMDEARSLEAELTRRRAELGDDELAGLEVLNDRFEELADEILAIRERLNQVGEGDGFDGASGPVAGSVGGPQQVELTPENAQLVADLLAGKITEEEFEAALEAQQSGGALPPEPPDINDVLPEPEGGDFEGDGGFGPQFPEARRVPRAKPIVPEGGDEEIQADLERQAAQQRAADAATDVSGLAGGSESVDPLMVIPAAIKGDLKGVAAALGPEAAAIAGPAAVVLGAAYVLEQQIIGSIERSGERFRLALDGATAAANRLAANDLSGLRDQVAEGVAGVSEEFGIVGSLWADRIRNVNAVMGSFEDVVEGFVARGRELSGLDTRLAAATAEADVQRLLDDLREAERTGEDLSRLTRSSSQIESYQRELLTLVKTEVIGLLSELLTPIGEIAAELKPLVAAVSDVNDSTKDVRRLVRSASTAGVVRLIRLLGSVAEKALELLGVDGRPKNGLLEEVFNVGRNIPLGGPAVNQTWPTAPLPGQVGVPHWFREAN